MISPIQQLNFAHHLPWIPALFTASGIVLNRPCIFRGFVMRPDGTMELEVTFYDGDEDPDNWIGGMNIDEKNFSRSMILSDGFVAVNTLLRAVVGGTIGGGYIGVYYQDYVGE